MRTITYRDALREAIREEMLRDERVFIMGEDIAGYGGTYAVSKGLFEEFGEKRVRDTPLARLYGVPAYYVRVAPGESVYDDRCTRDAVLPIVVNLAAARHAGVSLATLILDLVYPLLDPRIRTGRV